MADAIRWVCAGCGHEAAPDVLPIACPRAGEGDVDHALRRRFAPDAATAAELRRAFDAEADAESQPFVRFRGLLTSYRRALAAGADDGEWVALARRLDASVAAVDGSGFRVTPFALQPGLAEVLGVAAARVKDETGGVAGSHKGRHLMGLMLALEGEREWKGAASRDPVESLAIASCGNAALAAAVVARAVERPLDVFVPPHADRGILSRLRALGGRLHPCPRRDGEAGDPCFLRFRESLSTGAHPFTCQGSENGLVIEGGQTLAWEMAATLRDAEPLDRVVVQVGGGALATALMSGLEEARILGVVERLPRFHAVQTAGGWPLARAWDRLVEHLAAERGVDEALPADRAARAAWVELEVPPAERMAALGSAARHRSDFMRPWESPAASVAGGILDDETYDWLPVVGAMLATGGHPLVVEEATLVEARELAREATGIRVDATGAAGLAGALALRAEGHLLPRERLGLLFTGAERA